MLPRLWIRRFFAEISDIDRALRRHSRKESIAVGQLDKIVDDDAKMTISIDVSRFKPDELKVDLDGRVLTVEGKQETKEEHGYAMRSFVRQWTLPEDVNVV
ncbi:hypothetical protein COOONC_18057 [Cooperia oncophora]